MLYILATGPGSIRFCFRAMKRAERPELNTLDAMPGIENECGKTLQPGVRGVQANAERVVVEMLQCPLQGVRKSQYQAAVSYIESELPKRRVRIRSGVRCQRQSWRRVLHA